jgi:hypothetical protein
MPKTTYTLIPTGGGITPIVEKKLEINRASHITPVLPADFIERLGDLA